MIRIVFLCLVVAACGDASDPSRCERDLAALDQLDRALARCTADADCPCGARCTPVGACTYDCRDDLGCAEGLTCTADGRCAEVAP